VIRPEYQLHGAAALRLHSKPTAGRASAVKVIRPHPLAWELALAITGGDARRLRTQPDGSVLVSNQPRR
jgi:hypothetical protein